VDTGGAYPVGSRASPEEHGERPEQRQVRAQPVDGLDPDVIRDDAQHRGADPAQAEGEAEEEARDEADAPGDELLRVDEDGREGRRQHEADQHAERDGRVQAGPGKGERERHDAEDRAPDHPPRPDAIADGAAEDRPGGGRAQVHEQEELGGADVQVKPVHEVERVEVREARQVEVLREHQAPEHREREHDPRPGQGGCGRRGDGAAPALREVLAVPGAHPHHEQDGDQGCAREPGDARLAPRNDHQRREQRTDRRAGVAPDLEHGLGETPSASGRQLGHPGRLRVEHRRSDAHEPGRDEEQRQARCCRQQEKPHEAEAHARHERIRARAPVGVEAHERLQDRGRELVGEGDQPELREREPERLLQHGVDRDEQGLPHVVQHVAGADRQQHRNDRRSPLLLRHGGFLHVALAARRAGGTCGR
jgi:hypothetical protein